MGKSVERIAHNRKVRRLQKIVDFSLFVLKAYDVTDNSTMLKGINDGTVVTMRLDLYPETPVGYVVIWWGGDSFSIGYDRNTKKVVDTSRWGDDGKFTGSGGIRVSYSRITLDPEFTFDLIQYLVLVLKWEKVPYPGSHS